MKFQTIITFCICLLIFSCASNESADSNADASNDENTEVSNENEPTSDATTWEGFWAIFQKASAEKDQATLKSMCIFHDTFGEESFDTGFEVFFSDEMLKIIAEKSAENLAPIEGMMTDFEGVRSINYTEDESALIITFGKSDGKFGIVRFDMAG